MIITVLTGFVAASHAEFVISVTTDSVTVHISGDLLQAVPNPPAVNTSFPFGKMATFRVYLTGQNASSLSDSLNSAIREKSPSASASQVAFYANANGTSYHYTLSFNVGGVSATHGDIETVDLGWRSFAVNGDIKSGNYSLNFVLSTYLGNNILQLARLPVSVGPPLPRVRRWYWNERLIDSDQVQSITADAALLNFTSLNKPLEHWTTTPDIPAKIVRYQATTGFNITFHDQVTEVEEVANLITNAVYKIKADIEAPIGTVAAGDNLTLETRVAWSAWLMTASIATSVGVLASTSVLERRFQGSQKATMPRKPRK